MSQTQRIIEQLRAGDRPNHFFPTVMRIMNYTARISEARKDGYNITSYRKTEKSNTVWYHLEEQ